MIEFLKDLWNGFMFMLVMLVFFMVVLLVFTVIQGLFQGEFSVLWNYFHSIANEWMKLLGLFIIGGIVSTFLMKE